MSINDEQLIKLLKKMAYEYYPAGKEVMRYGEAGDKFYFIIRGSVSIAIPKNALKRRTIRPIAIAAASMHLTSLLNKNKSIVEPV